MAELINIKKVNIIHNEIMDIYQDAISSKNESIKKELVLNAFYKAKDLALIYKDRPELEPTRNFLFSNAIEIGDTIFPELNGEVESLIEIAGLETFDNATRKDILKIKNEIISYKESNTNL